MANRGRKSADELAALHSATVDPALRAEPPIDLTAEEAREWVKVVNRMPADWFPAETLPMLAQYCRHVVGCRRIAYLIQDLSTFNETCGAYDIDGDAIFDAEGNPIRLRCAYPVEEYDRLLRMQDREGRALTSLATKMRMTQQTTYDKSRKKPNTGNPLWDDVS